MPSLRRTSLVLLMAAAWTSRAPAQAPLLTQPLDSGTLVRLQLTSGDRLRGRLLAPLQPASERVELCRYPGNPCSDSTGEQTVATLSNAVRLELAAGNHAVRGGVAGALGIVAVALLANATVGAANDNTLSAGTVVSMAVVAGVIGALAGSTDIVWRRAP